MASAFSTVWMWLYSLDCLYARYSMDSQRILWILPKMSSSVAWALTLPAADGRSAVKLASTKCSVTLTLPLSMTSCPGRGMYTSPPSVLGMGERAWVRADSQKRLAIRSSSAILRDAVE